MLLSILWLFLAALLTTVPQPGNNKPAPHVSSAPPGNEVQSSGDNFEVQKLAEGVFAVIRKDSPGLMVEANSVFIINDDDVIVVDAPASTKEVLAALRKLTHKPVKYVINTHWHDDHIIGNQLYRDAYPAVEFIGHANLLEYLPTTGVDNRKRMLEGAPPFAARMRSLMEQNKNLAGEMLTDEERVSYASDLKLIDRYLPEVRGNQIVLPTLAFETRLTLHRGRRTIDIRDLGPGHTSGDIVVHLPRDGILISGDLVVWPVPLVGSDQSRVTDWSATLAKISALRPAVIVPGHGPLLRDDSYVKLMATLFASIQQQTQAAVARGESLEQVRKSVQLDELRRQFAGDSRLKNFIFDTYVTGPAVAAAFREASAKKP